MKTPQGSCVKERRWIVGIRIGVSEKYVRKVKWTGMAHNVSEFDGAFKS